MMDNKLFRCSFESTEPTESTESTESSESSEFAGVRRLVDSVDSSRVHIHLSREKFNRIVNVQRFADDESLGVLDHYQRTEEPLTRFDPPQKGFCAEGCFRLRALGIEEL